MAVEYRIDGGAGKAFRVSAKPHLNRAIHVVGRSFALRTYFPNLPDGLNEIYFHPATTSDLRLSSLMPDYEHQAELAALLDPEVRAALAQAGVKLTTYGAD